VYKKTTESEDNLARGGAKKKKGRGGTQAQPQAQPQSEQGSQAKKEKFVPLLTSGADSMKLPGRQPCECQAAKHPLVSNCLACGRVVCEQEGPGPCLFCGRLVVTKQEREVLDRGSRKSEQLLKKLAGDSREQYQVALDNKERLLEYDANCEKRTKVIDDESDYFNVDSNKWLTPEQRAALVRKNSELQEEKHKSRLDRKITFDFAGRRLLEDTSLPDYKIEKDTKLLELFKNDAFSVEAEIKARSEQGVVANPNINRSRPMYDAEAGGLGRGGGSVSQNQGSRLKRLQDKELMEMSDDGMCLSMHQPWASLLVMGIKIHEGRSWYSAHRGRLWVHSGSKVPSAEDIQTLENFYKSRGVSPRAFPPPNGYPTSCLLGCVDVQEVLSQEEYQAAHPMGESASPYVFICSNPQELVVKFPMSGKHKIYKLDSNLHNAAKKTAKKSP